MVRRHMEGHCALALLTPSFPPSLAVNSLAPTLACAHCAHECALPPGLLRVGPRTSPRSCRAAAQTRSPSHSVRGATLPSARSRPSSTAGLAQRGPAASASLEVGETPLSHHRMIKMERSQGSRVRGGACGSDRRLPRRPQPSRRAVRSACETRLHARRLAAAAREWRAGIAALRAAWASSANVAASPTPTMRTSAT